MGDRQNPNPDELVAVFDNIDPTLVSIARDALSPVKIESFIFDENASRIGYGGAHYIPSRLMVYADKADEARECLRESGIQRIGCSSPLGRPLYGAPFLHYLEAETRR
jgi:hypothetical protein